LDQSTASKLIEENLHTIFAWSMSKLYNKSEAEDLTNDIICAVLKSVSTLREDEVFWGFLWRIAENTLYMRLRKKKYETVEYDEKFVGAYWETPEDTFIQSEQILLLRRELSLLSKQYREVTVLYYIHGKSCSEISSKLNISIEMVKYYLFKTRKILKEGIGMTREFGEKSYNPSTFRMDYWGGGSNGVYQNILDRKLPGNILLSAYDKPVTISELSLELGVASPYLEDELGILLEHELISKIGEKYQTNIIIFTEEYEKIVLEKFKPVYEASAEIFNEKISALLPKLKKISFYGKDNKNICKDDNALKWIFSNIAIYHALQKSDKLGKEKYGNYPPLSNGSYGFVFGYDNDYENHHFNGICGYCASKEEDAWFSVENYKIIERCQHFLPSKWEETNRAMHDAILQKPLNEENEHQNQQIIELIQENLIFCKDGILYPSFPVFESNLFNTTLKEMLASLSAEVGECMEKICEIAANTLKDYAPAALKDKFGQLTHIHYQMDVMAFILETMVEKGQLLVPEEKVNLCIFGVKK